MLIDKSIGYLCRNDESDYIDDIAFQLYLNYHFRIYGTLSPSKQIEFMSLRNKSYVHYLSSFYENAFNVLRKEKLEEIENA